MYKILTAALVVIFMSGCATSLSSFDRSEFSGIKKNRVAVALINDKTKFDDSVEPISSFIKNDEKLKLLISSECKTPPMTEALVLGAIPVVTALGKLAFDLYIDNQIKAAEELKKAAQSSYSEKVRLVDGNLDNKNCAIIARYSTDPKKQNEIGLIALIKIIKDSESAIVISPRYIKATNSVAVTKKNTDSNLDKINLSFAISTKAIGKQQSGLNGLFAVGEGTFSVPNVQIGPQGKPYECPDRSVKPKQAENACPTSDIVAYPTAAGPVSITFAVTETGDIGIDLDQSIAELKAIKEAIGPALKDSLKEYLK